MEWTSETPKQKGWYWIHGFLWDRKIVPVFTRPGHDYLCVNHPDVCNHTKSDFLCVEKLGAMWSGPIEPPKEKPE